MNMRNHTKLKFHSNVKDLLNVSIEDVVVNGVDIKGNISRTSYSVREVFYAYTSIGEDVIFNFKPEY